jgi:hypothetical protein
LTGGKVLSYAKSLTLMPKFANVAASGCWDSRTCGAEDGGFDALPAMADVDVNGCVEGLGHIISGFT